MKPVCRVCSVGCDVSRVPDDAEHGAGWFRSSCPSCGTVVYTPDDPTKSVASPCPRTTRSEVRALSKVAHREYQSRRMKRRLLYEYKREEGRRIALKKAKLARVAKSIWSSTKSWNPQRKRYI